MLHFYSESYYAEVIEGIANIYKNTDLKIREVEFIGNEKRVKIHTRNTDSTLGEYLRDLEDIPELRLAYAGEGLFHVDVASTPTSEQRWKGLRREKLVRESLDMCKFSKADIDLMIDELMDHPKITLEKLK